MLRSLSFVFTLTILSLVLVTPSYADSPQQPPHDAPKHVRILTIGNSFTHNATRYLGEIVEAVGHKLTHKMLSIGGSPLELHAKKALAYETDPADELARYKNGDILQEALQSERWDFVTIQQLSIKSHDIKTYRPYAQQLADIIRRDAPQAKLLIHQTWAYRSDDPRFHRPKPAAAEPATQQAMYDGLSEAYKTITAELSASRIPVGDAFWMSDNDENFGYRSPDNFDASSIQSPNLPEQTHSLHVGYRWRDRDGKQKLSMDGHHASQAGEYLGACVWFECLYDQSPVGNDFVPKELDVNYAAHLQTIAHQAALQGGDVILGLTTSTSTP
ncbi:DUF4886 domain-containing protein [Rhodopirellula bahusiensis]|uniref:DUF4886 domain-containing protein n=1 Tax=Rhodopirellula bahusiensis TaxID=2014065 RepID=UPI003264E613